jgi:molybdopterin-containing oxidoreductase family iron-sulfur binding subunit
VQRINTKKIDAEKENRQVRDGEIQTACQQTCPTQAIVFGDINDPDSRVSRLKSGSLNYGLLTELNTKPRTTYQAKLRNPNSEIENT